MTKIEINGRAYCVETLIYTVERLTKDVKASAEYHRLVLKQIRAEQEALITTNSTADYSNGVMNCLDIIDGYMEDEE